MPTPFDVQKSTFTPIHSLRRAHYRLRHVVVQRVDEVVGARPARPGGAIARSGPDEESTSVRRSTAHCNLDAVRARCASFAIGYTGRSSN
jgi:hypothetical protein